MRLNQKPHSAMQATRKMNSVGPVWSGLIYLAWQEPPKAAVTYRQIRCSCRQQNILIPPHYTFCRTFIGCHAVWELLTHLGGNANFGLTIRCIFLMLQLL